MTQGVLFFQGITGIMQQVFSPGRRDFSPEDFSQGIDGQSALLRSCPCVCDCIVFLCYNIFLRSNRGVLEKIFNRPKVGYFREACLGVCLDPVVCGERSGIGFAYPAQTLFAHSSAAEAFTKDTPGND